MTGHTTISIYPVGLLAAWKHRRMPARIKLRDDFSRGEA